MINHGVFDMLQNIAGVWLFQPVQILSPKILAWRLFWEVSHVEVVKSLCYSPFVYQLWYKAKKHLESEKFFLRGKGWNYNNNYRLWLAIYPSCLFHLFFHNDDKNQCTPEIPSSVDNRTFIAALPLWWFDAFLSRILKSISSAGDWQSELTHVWGGGKVFEWVTALLGNSNSRPGKELSDILAPASLSSYLGGPQIFVKSFIPVQVRVYWILSS